MILTVTLNPCVDHTLFVDNLKLHDRNKVTRLETDAGGKGINLSRMVAELGGDTTATGFMGGDCGKYVETVLTGQGVAIDFVHVAGDTRTNVVVETGDGPPTVFSSPGCQVTGIDWENLIGKVVSLSSRSVWVAFGGSFPPGVPSEAYQVLGQVARDAGARILIDADGAIMLEAIKASPDMVKPNLDEAERILGRAVTTLGDAIAGAKELRQTLANGGAKDPVATISLGSQGAVCASSEGVFYGEAPKVEAKSTIGSGDSFLGAFLLALVNGSSYREALRHGIAAGAATALSDGTRIGTAEDARRLLPLCTVLDEPDLHGMVGGPVRDA